MLPLAQPAIQPSKAGRGRQPRRVSLRWTWRAPPLPMRTGSRSRQVGRQQRAAPARCANRRRRNALPTRAISLDRVACRARRQKKAPKHALRRFGRPHPSASGIISPAASLLSAAPASAHPPHVAGEPTRAKHRSRACQRHMTSHSSRQARRACHSASARAAPLASAHACRLEPHASRQRTRMHSASWTSGGSSRQRRRAHQPQRRRARPPRASARSRSRCLRAHRRQLVARARPSIRSRLLSGAARLRLTCGAARAAVRARTRGAARAGTQGAARSPRTFESVRVRTVFATCESVRRYFSTAVRSCELVRVRSPVSVCRLHNVPEVPATTGLHAERPQRAGGCHGYGSRGWTGHGRPSAVLATARPWRRWPGLFCVRQVFWSWAQPLFGR